MSWVSSRVPLPALPKNRFGANDHHAAHFLPFFGPLLLTYISPVRVASCFRRFVLRPPRSPAASPTDFRHPLSNGRPPLRTRVARRSLITFFIRGSRPKERDRETRDGRSRSVRLIGGKKMTDMLVVLSTVINQQRGDVSLTGGIRCGLHVTLASTA